jgi:hypothetical protein
LQEVKVGGNASNVEEVRWVGPKITVQELVKRLEGAKEVL